MEVKIPFGSESRIVQINLPSKNFIVAKSKNPSTDKSWAEVVGEAIHRPVDAKAINKQRLKGKKVVVITDAALQNVLAKKGSNIWLVILPEGRMTLPKEKLYQRG